MRTIAGSRAHREHVEESAREQGLRLADVRDEAMRAQAPRAYAMNREWERRFPMGVPVPMWRLALHSRALMIASRLQDFASWILRAR